MSLPKVRIAVVGLKKKKRWHSKNVAAPNPVFNEVAVFKDMTPGKVSVAFFSPHLHK